MKLKEKLAIKFAKGHCTSGNAKLNAYLEEIRAFAFEAGFERGRDAVIDSNSAFWRIDDRIDEIGEEDVSCENTNTTIIDGIPIPPISSKGYS